MPKLDSNEIEAAIAKGEIFALSIDTSIFDRYGCNLLYPVLSKVDQFKDGAIEVVLSEIVTREVLAHIKANLEEAQREVKRTVEKYRSSWQADPLKKGFDLTSDATPAAEARLKAYTDSVDATVLPAAESLEMTTEVLRRYFAKEDPFEDKEKKKHEFPDAFALVSLEKYASDRKKQILCVSADKGWGRFAENSPHLVCLPDLEVALSYFNSSGRNIADRTVVAFRKGAADMLAEELKDAIQRRLDRYDFLPDCSTSFNFESEPAGAEVKDIERDSATDPVVIEATDDDVTFTINVTAVVEFEAYFSFYVRDSIDGDDVHLDSCDRSIEKEVEFEVAITVQRSDDPEPEVIDVEARKKFINVSFGHIEPFEDQMPEEEGD